MAVYKWNRYSVAAEEKSREITYDGAANYSNGWYSFFSTTAKPYVSGKYYYTGSFAADTAGSTGTKSVAGKYITKSIENLRSVLYGQEGANIAAYDYTRVPLKGTFTEYYLQDAKGNFSGNVYSASSVAYPSNGISGDYWYEALGAVSTGTVLTVPEIAMEGKSLPVGWASIDGATAYVLERRADSGNWVQVYSGSGTSFEDTTGTWSTVQYRVRASFSGTNGDYTTSAAISVVSASALVISGTDGDLGELSADVEYTCSSSGDGDITVTETVNGVYERTFTAVNGAANKISVLDLPAGSGTIHLTASTNPGSGVVTVTREWNYTKTAPAFADSGAVSRLEKDGKNLWPMTIPEAVRAPRLFGGDLGKALEKLAPFVPRGAVLETGAYTGTGTYGSSAKNKLVFRNRIALVFIVRASYPHGLLLPFVAGNTQTAAYIGESGGDPTIFYEVNGSEVSWYANGQALNQLNASGATYLYAALTIPGGEA